MSFRSGTANRLDRHYGYGFGMGVFGFILFPLVDTGSFLWITVAVCIGQVIIGMMYGPQAAFLAEMFSTHVRYSSVAGVPVGRHLRRRHGAHYRDGNSRDLWQHDRHFGLHRHRQRDNAGFCRAAFRDLPARFTDGVTKTGNTTVRAKTRKSASNQEKPGQLCRGEKPKTHGVSVSTVTRTALISGAP